MNSNTSRISLFKVAPIDVVAALMAGLAAGTSMCLLNLMYHPPAILRYSRFILYGIVLYCLPLLIARVSRHAGFAVPSWFFVAVLGSTLFAIAILLPSAMQAWNDPLRLEHTLSSFVFNELSAGISLVFVLVALTVPIAALIYHSKELKEGLQKWHEGPETLSILQTSASRK
ncbi:MAG: hypothetical protein WAM70_13790 [Pyrinomonadaceae bacterium]